MRTTVTMQAVITRFRCSVRHTDSALPSRSAQPQRIHHNPRTHRRKGSSRHRLLQSHDIWEEGLTSLIQIYIANAG